MSDTSKEQMKSLVRHVLTSLGGLLIAQGYVDHELVSEIVGTGVAATGLIWAVWSKKGK